MQVWTGLQQVLDLSNELYGKQLKLKSRIKARLAPLASCLSLLSFSSFLLFPANAACILIIAALLLRPSPSAAIVSDNVHSRTFRRTDCHGWLLRQWPQVRGLVKRAASDRRSRRRPGNSCLASPSARCRHGVVHHVV